MKRYFFIILAFIILSGCQLLDPSHSISSEAEEYLNAALDIMQNHSINRYKIEWTHFREETFDYAGSSQTTWDTYPAIVFALRNLGDYHSFLQEPLTNSNAELQIQSNDEPILSLPSSEAGSLHGIKIKENIGYLRIPTFTGSDVASLNFANAIQNLIKEVDSSSVEGWIVDLRHNGGGNMWPMLAGVGPILGNGLAGKFVDPDNNVSNWFYEDGKSRLGNSVIIEVIHYYELFNSNPHVAVLTDDKTASSGEAIVIAFKGRPITRSFGIPTRGLSTANQGFELSDGATLYLTVSTMADRNGNLYGGTVLPDETVYGELKEDPTDNDLVVMAAIKWLENSIGSKR